MNISDFKIATDKKDGVWLDWEDAQFLIAYAHRAEYNRAAARVAKKYPANKLKADPALALPYLIDILAEGVLLDWRNVNDNGKPLDCTYENKVRLLSIEPLRDWIYNESRELTNFREEAMAEDAAEAKSVGGVDASVGRKRGASE